MNLVENLKTLQEAGLSDRNAFLLLDQLAAVERAKVDLKDTVAFLQRSLERVQRDLAVGHNLNSLGEVQGQGLAVDRLCVELHAREATVDVLCRALGVELETLGLA